MVKTNVFSFLDVKKAFYKESDHSISIQLRRFAARDLIFRLKKGLYCFDPKDIDEMVLAGIIAPDSYISLESALNYYGMIPDIPLEITSVCVGYGKKAQTTVGVFRYHKIAKKLFWGYEAVASPKEGFYNLAQKEKALLDFFYLRKIKTVSDLRLDLRDFNFQKYKKFLKFYPKWVGKIKLP